QWPRPGSHHSALWQRCVTATPKAARSSEHCALSGSKATTKQVLFVQGGGEGAHDRWDDKLVASLARDLGPSYEILYPLMPNEDDPNYARWKSALQCAFAGLEDGAILVAHSIGATILINVLADDPSKRKFGGVFLIATPFVGNG